MNEEAERLELQKMLMNDGTSSGGAASTSRVGAIGKKVLAGFWFADMAARRGFVQTPFQDHHHRVREWWVFEMVVCKWPNRTQNTGMI